MSVVKKIIVKNFTKEFEEGGESFLKRVNNGLNSEGAFIHSFTPHFDEEGIFDGGVAVLIKGEER